MDSLWGPSFLVFLVMGTELPSLRNYGDATPPRHGLLPPLQSNAARQPLCSLRKIYKQINPAFFAFSCPSSSILTNRSWLLFSLTTVQTIRTFGAVIYWGFHVCHVCRICHICHICHVCHVRQDGQKQTNNKIKEIGKTGGTKNDKHDSLIDSLF